MRLVHHSPRVHAFAALLGLAACGAPNGPRGGPSAAGSEAGGALDAGSNSETGGASHAGSAATSAGGVASGLGQGARAAGGAPLGAAGGRPGESAGGSSGGLGLAGAGAMVAHGGGTSDGGNASGGDAFANVVVLAGDFDRDHTIVSFAYAAGKAEVLALRDAQGLELPVQIDENGIATFILPFLAKNTEARFTLVRPTQTTRGGATAKVLPGAYELSVGGNRVLEFVTARRSSCSDASIARAGYVYPVYTPSGAVGTDDCPPNEVNGEMHAHHHGIWSAWTRTQFNGRPVDFWNPVDWRMPVGHGRIDLDAAYEPWQGPVHTGFLATLLHEDVGYETRALDERWTIRVYSTHAGLPPYFVFDLESKQEAVNSPLRLEVYHYGGFAFRGAPEWKGGNFRFLTSMNATSQLDQDVAPKADWVHIGGQVGGKEVGYALLAHPSNHCTPQGLRLHPTDPYFAMLPVTKNGCGAFDIVSKTPYVTRLRFVASDGAADKDLLNRLWNDYATPPQVIVQ